jgi:hypothetical protein
MVMRDDLEAPPAIPDSLSSARTTGFQEQLAWIFIEIHPAFTDRRIDAVQPKLSRFGESRSGSLRRVEECGSIMVRAVIEDRGGLDWQQFGNSIGNMAPTWLQ